MAEKSVIKLKNRPEIVVLSRNYSTGLGIIRSLGSCGYTVDLVASVSKKGSSIIASSSRFVRKSTEVKFSSLQNDPGAEIVNKLIEMGDCDNLKVLFPADDYTASVMDNNRSKLAPFYIMPYIENGQDGDMVRLMDKTVQGKLAEEAGILVPAEWVISLEKDIDIPDDMIYPCFVKPVESVSGYKTEMKKCIDREDLYKHLKTMQAFFNKRSVLIQEFLEIEREYDLSGLCLNEEIIVPAIVMKTNIAKHERGVTMAGKLVSPEIMGPVLEKMKTMLKEFHYYGMFDMEFNVAGDRIYFNEVNLRSGGPNFSYFLNGVNLPAIFVKEITGQGHDKREEEVNSFGKSFVYEKVAWEEYIHGCISAKERKQSIKEADYTLLKYADDPTPGRIFFIKIRLSALKRKVLG